MAATTSQERELGNPNQQERRSLPGLVAALLLLATVAGGIAAHFGAAVGDTPLSSPGSSPGPSGSRSAVGPQAGLDFEASAAGPVHLSGRLDRGALLRGGDGVVGLELRIHGEEPVGAAAMRVPTDLVVVLDRSGSMQGPPLANAKAAARELMERLGSEDRFALVSYASQASLDVPLAGIDFSLAERAERAHSALSRLLAVQARGGTNMAAGLDLAASLVASRQPGRTVRVVLLSDGHANEGDASASGLRRRVLDVARAESVLSAVGVGQGFDEGLMASLADAGTGNFYYVANAEDLGGVFAGELASARETVASLLAVAIDLPDGVEVVDAAGYPLEHDGRRVVFRPGSLFAGQERRIWVTLSARRAAAREHPASIELGRVSLSYRSQGEESEIGLDRPLEVTRVETEDDFYAALDPEAWAQSKLVDGYNGLKQLLSSSLARGDRAEAEALITSYHATTSALNAQLQRTDVAEQLIELRALQADVDVAFTSPSAPSAARLRKELAAEGYDGRRVGAKK